MLNSEQVFDMLPLVVDIYDKLNVDSYRAKLHAENTGKNVDAKEVGISVIKYIFKNSGKVKEEVFGMVATAEGKSIDEVKLQPFIDTLKTFMEIFSDKDTVDFFKSAMQ